MIAIINYGLGNIDAFVNLYNKRLNIPVHVATSADDLKGVTRIILPGVGAFDHAMDLLERSGMREPLDDLVLRQKVPVLGICVGMQILAERSDEGQRGGLGWIPGEVKSLKAAQQATNQRRPMPHMGWNDVRPVHDVGLFKGLEADAKFYFLHSFYFACAKAENVGAVCEYGLEFCCAVTSGNIHGVQFHPEKSHRYGMRLLQNFAEA